MKKLQTAGLLLLGLALADQTARAELVIGGFDASRGGSYSLRDGGGTAPLREAIAQHFPGATLTASDTLTGAYLSGVNVLVLSSVWADDGIPVAPLRGPEQAALLDFVRAGGKLLLFGDTELAYGEASNSLVSPFGVHLAGTLPGVETATVLDPSAHPLTSGPFGEVRTLWTAWSGWFDDLGPYALALATLDANGEAAVAAIGPEALSPGSGEVFLFSDTAFMAQDVFLNGLWPRQALANPEPASLTLLGLGALCLLGYGWRRRKRVG